MPSLQVHEARLTTTISNLTNLIQNEIMSAVVIVSNDRVLPYDVTTKDDLFYEVSCDYSGTDLQHLREGVLVRGGIVVGLVVLGCGLVCSYLRIRSIELGKRDRYLNQNNLINELLRLRESFIHGNPEREPMFHQRLSATTAARK